MTIQHGRKESFGCNLCQSTLNRLESIGNFAASYAAHGIMSIVFQVLTTSTFLIVTPQARLCFECPTTPVDSPWCVPVKICLPRIFSGVKCSAFMFRQRFMSRHLNSWHYSFAAARATVGGRLPMSRSCRMQLLAFYIVTSKYLCPETQKNQTNQVNMPKWPDIFHLAGICRVSHMKSLKNGPSSDFEIPGVCWGCTGFLSSVIWSLASWITRAALIFSPSFWRVRCTLALLVVETKEGHGSVVEMGGNIWRNPWHLTFGLKKVQKFWLNFGCWIKRSHF